MQLHIQSVTPEALTVELIEATRTERASLMKWALSIEPEDPRYIPCLTGELSVLTDKASPKILQNGGGFEHVTVSTKTYLEPYLTLLKQRTGFVIETLECPCLIDWNPSYLLESARIQQDELIATIALRVYPYIDETLTPETRRTRAMSRALEKLQERIGATLPNPEFIPANDSGTLYKRNPKYPGRGTATRPGACYDPLWQTLFGAFMAQQATEAQQNIMNRRAHVFGSRTLWPSVNDSTLYLDDYKTALPWTEFATGTIPPLPAPTPEGTSAS